MDEDVGVSRKPPNTPMEILIVICVVTVAASVAATFYLNLPPLDNQQ